MDVGIPGVVGADVEQGYAERPQADIERGNGVVNAILERRTLSRWEVHGHEDEAIVQVGERPPENWKLLKPYTAHIHIKDAVLSDGHIVPAGKGDGGIGQVLPDAYRSGYRGFVSLEPHLAADQQFSGFSGPRLFKVAADALKDLCRRSGVPLAGA